MKNHFDHIPLAPRRYPFFYGWMIVLMGAIGFLMSSPGQTYGVSPFTDSLMAALGLTRVQLSVAYMFGTVSSSLCLTYAGRAYDRFGARVVAPAASLILGVVLVLLSQCDRIAGSAAAVLHLKDSSAMGFVILLLLFFVLRFSGQGVLTMVSSNMTMKWFDRHRGLVTGLSGMVIAPAFSATPAILNALVEGVGWRGAWLWLAAIIGVAFTIVALLFFRDNPEACGLKPDGPLADRALGSRRAKEGERRQYTLVEARRSYGFWVFAVGLALFAFYITGMSFHAASIFEAAGMDRGSGYMIFLYASIVSVTLRPLVGWLCDRIPLKFLLMAMLTGVIISALGMRVLREGLPMWTVVAGNGLCGATLGTLASVTWPNFYGRRHLGAISGFSMAITVFASAIGPWLFSQSKAATGSYAPATTGAAIVAAIFFFLATKANPPTAE
ncbi:MAG: MFS transporter [Kiritimatiellia bacterium]|jgi:MFS family permease|nr:MFS transporter [Kiritimatiellia bacterium]